MAGWPDSWGWASVPPELAGGQLFGRANGHDKYKTGPGQRPSWGGASQLQVEKPEGGWNPHHEAKTWPENCCANCQLEMKTPDLGAGGGW